MSGLFNLYFNVKYDGLKNLYALKDEPIIFLPKHQSAIDAFLFMDLFRRIKRKPYFVMKSTLPSFFEYFGGIPIIRKKDVDKKIKQIKKLEKEYDVVKKKIREYLELALIKRDYAYNRINELIENGESVIIEKKNGKVNVSKGKGKNEILLDEIDMVKFLFGTNFWKVKGLKEEIIDILKSVLPINVFMWEFDYI